MSETADTAKIEALLAELFEGELSSEKRRELEALLTNDKKARELYFDYCEMHAMLQWEHGVLGQAKGLREVLPPATDAKTSAPRQAIWMTWSAGAAAALLIVALLGYVISDRPVNEEAQLELRAGEFVARVTGSKNCQLVGTSVAFQTGETLRQGHTIDLASGYAEITFDSGAQVLLEGPAALQLNSAWEAVLRRGTLKANVPPEAIGFRISTPSVDVIDLGTEFSMVADESGATEVFVLKGSVQAAPIGDNVAAPGKILLKEKEARRFAVSGSSEVADRERKAKRWANAVALERYAGPTEYVHWSFDEAGGKLAKAQSVGAAAGVDASFKGVSDTVALRVEGRFGKALKLDGDPFAKVPFAGISNNTARTVAFWIRLPEDSQLSDGDTALAWVRRDRKRAGVRAVQIGWNSNAAQGPLGTLRTELGRGFVMGSTPLRDGKWHHVVITFVPGKKPGEGVHVSQYVDGRLDGITVSRHKDFRTAERGESEEMISETLFIGSGVRPQQESKFRGELDELYIVNRALAPREIRQLMNQNALTAEEVAQR